MKILSGRNSALATVTLLLSFGLSCHDNGTGPNTSNVQLSADDVAVTEVWLRVQLAAGLQHPGILELMRNDSVISVIPRPPADTILLDGKLYPKRNYTYRAGFFGSLYTEISGPLAVTTMDTTSHNFTWQIDTLGDGNSSVLNDVAIINDTLVYAVGEIYKRDSTGQFETEPYNAAVWNGALWKLMRVPTAMYGGFVGTYRLQTIFAFGSSDLWTFSIAGSYSHWDGNQWQTQYVAERSGGGLKLWGTSSSNLYLVGTTGSISHFDGHSWQKIQSGTTLDIQDIWGAQNKAGQWEVLAVAGNYYVSNERKILAITGTTVTTLSDSGINWALNGLWFSPGRHYWVVGDGVWEKPFTLTVPRWHQDYITTYVTNRIRGNEINDVFFCGAYGDLFHFNGVSWQSFRSNTALSAGQYLSLAAMGNTVFAVGYEYPRAVIARGTRITSRSERR